MKWDWGKFWGLLLQFILNMFARPMVKIKNVVFGKPVEVKVNRPGHLPKNHPYYFPTREEWLEKQNEK